MGGLDHGRVRNPTLIDRGAIDEAWAMLAAPQLAGELPPTWPSNVARHQRGCLHAAAGTRQAALSPTCWRPASCAHALGHPETQP